jgi:hypothetical protein
VCRVFFRVQSRTAGQEIPSYNGPNVYYRTHKSSPSYPTVDQLDPVLIFTAHSLRPVLILSRIWGGGGGVTIRLVLDWFIAIIYTLCTQLETASDTALTLTHFTNQSDTLSLLSLH